MKKIFEILGLTQHNGLFIISEEKWKGKLSQRTEEILERIIRPYAFFLFNNEPVILFFGNPDNEQQIFRQCWNFNQSPVIFIIRNDEIEIYNGFSFIKEEGKFKLAELSKKNWETDFSFFNIISGKVWEKYKKELDLTNRVDEKLLRNIKALRKELIEKHNLSPQITNNLIGRIIFIRYLIDRNVIIGFYKENEGKLTNDGLCQILKSEEETYRLFEYIKRKFNGNLFPISENESKQVKAETHLNELIKLLTGMEISRGQLSLFDIYDFAIIPIELVSNIYEFFIGKSEQEKKGAYYTPLFVVRHILHETVHRYFEEKKSEFNCKILDPACGSGVFLIEALRKIISQYRQNTCNFDDYMEKLPKLLTDNIFGIDKDENAINVAIFSLYVTLLDYLEPPEIVDFSFPPLLNSNFFVADFFDLNEDYNKKLSKNNQSFNFIIGNPPWGKISESVSLYEKYWRNREKIETMEIREKRSDFTGKIEIKVSNKESAQVFLIRSSDFNFEECAFVVTSKVLYNLNARIFRQYFLSNFAIRKIFELSSIRHEIFDKSNDPSNCPASILFYSYSPDKEKNRQNLVTHISLKPNRFFEIFKMFVIEKHDRKQLFQSYFSDFDWIWKVLVYGNISDFYFVYRLKKKFKRISEIISNKDEFIVGQGIMVGGGDKNPIPELSGLPYIDTSNSDVKQFFIRLRKNSVWKHGIVHRPRDTSLFQSPALLITGGINTFFKSVSGISYTTSVFRSSLTAIKAFSYETVPILKTINGLLNSDLFAYYITATGSSVGIEREETHDEEKFNFPYQTSEKLVELVTQIEQTAKQKCEIEDKELQLSQKYGKIGEQYNRLLMEIDDEILKIFQINNQEKAFIDYAHEISIPMIKRRDRKKIFGELRLQNKTHKAYLKEYAKIFTDHFNNIFNTQGNCVEVEIWLSSYIIGMYFNVISNPSTKENQILWKEDNNTNKLLKKFAAISFSEQNQNLFIQKDIKGFEENAFYIVKPNEYKCWHRAVAYLDLSELIDAIGMIGFVRCSCQTIWKDLPLPEIC